MQIPSNSASILQSLNMIWAFSENNCHVKVCVNSKELNLIHNVVNKYNLNMLVSPEIICIKTKNKGLYSFLFFIYVFKNWIFNKKNIFFARDLKEGYCVSILKKYIKRNHFFIYEMHDSVYLEKSNSLKIDDLSIKKKENFILHE